MSMQLSTATTSTASLKISGSGSGRVFPWQPTPTPRPSRPFCPRLPHGKAAAELGTARRLTLLASYGCSH